MNGPSPLDYAPPPRRPRAPPRVASAGPPVLLGLGLASYAGSRWLRAAGLTRRDFLLSLRTALEGLSPLLLAAGLVWAIVAALATRRPAAVGWLVLNAAALAFVVYLVFLSVKK